MHREPGDGNQPGVIDPGTTSEGKAELGLQSQEAQDGKLESQEQSTDWGQESEK